MEWIRLDYTNNWREDPHTEEIHDHTEGVAIMMSPAAANALMEWQPVTSRIMIDRFNSNWRKVIIIQCYTPLTMQIKRQRKTFYNTQ
ncbi:hypothetical protein DPMN_090355 [Dreissena polymorpha]|uniref:Uncharacterized protein n=1 Tax=Dreissena polymorpha TaxID=45954 RepID=A0A9D4KXK2_DREPO|nr:hypothetical protein DPMN_090355 [Dreissena polymorpha]